MSVAQVEMDSETERPKQGYSDEFKANTILPVLRGEKRAVEAANEAGISNVTLYQWIKDARANPNPPPPPAPAPKEKEPDPMPKSRSHLTDEQKREAVDAIQRKELTPLQAAEKYGVHPQTMYTWTSRFKKGKPLTGKHGPRVAGGRGRGHSEETKASALAPVLAGKMTAYARGKQLGISPSMLRRWQFEAEGGKKKATSAARKGGRDIDKAEAVAPVLAGEQSIAERARELKMPMPTLWGWVTRAKRDIANGSTASRPYGLDKPKGHAIATRRPQQQTLLPLSGESAQARCNALAQILVSLDGLPHEAQVWALKAAAGAVSAL